ncbi:Uncharacterised protein [Mycobacteroides abscessus subsp. massiliense]|nr:Uncharacterised protein [Mycobacteroides abscessus subsp. massiliense]
MLTLAIGFDRGVVSLGEGALGLVARFTQGVGQFALLGSTFACGLWHDVLLSWTTPDSLVGRRLLGRLPVNIRALGPQLLVEGFALRRLIGHQSEFPGS